MSFQIERGLFQLNFTDYHAILGVSVDAEIKDIRKRYLKIARRLHPDSFASEREEDKQHASQLLSKLVNPAWEKLSQERDRTEYLLLLKLKGQQGARQQGALELSNLSQQLSTAANVDHFYATSLKSLAEKQYEQLDQVLELTAQISELNLVYLMRKESNGEALTQSKRPIYTPDAPQSSPTSGKPGTPAPPPPQPRESLVDQYLRRAEVSIAKENFAQAILELRGALEVEPNNSRCHSLMGVVYLRQKQATMAKIHFNKALQLNPEDEVALDGKKTLEQAQTATGKSGATATGKPASKAPPGGSKPNKDKPGGGLFGGLFGGKKK